MPEDRTDESLMEAVASGNYEAFEELVRRYQNFALGVAHKLVNNPDRAEELAQQAFLKILRNAENYEATASFRTYLGRVVSRLCYDANEKNKPTLRDPFQEKKRNERDKNPLNEVLKEERKQKIQSALDQLPERQRTAIVLQSFEDFTYEQIATSMDTTTKAVERLLSRARQTLRSELSDLNETPVLDRDSS
jgi:RNA polymerase sigma-70 factor (ECF subfamily)